MVMQFCPKCKSLIIPRVFRGKTLLLCNSCGWWKEVNGEKSLKEVDKMIKAEGRAEGVVDDGNSLATFEHKCSKCGYMKAEICDLGVQYSDEDNLILLRCGKCGNTERLGEKTG